MPWSARSAELQRSPCTLYIASIHFQHSNQELLLMHVYSQRLLHESALLFGSMDISCFHIPPLLVASCVVIHKSPSRRTQLLDTLGRVTDATLHKPLAVLEHFQETIAGTHVGRSHAGCRHARLPDVEQLRHEALQILHLHTCRAVAPCCRIHTLKFPAFSNSASSKGGHTGLCHR
jgi:hypothetical protein